MIFLGRNEIKATGPQGISALWGWVRNYGKTWHGGADINGLDDKKVRMPSYKGKTISGTVVRSRIVTNKSNATWEWGRYVCVKLDNNQTPDKVNYLYFCHNSSLCVKVGDKVKTGDVLAIMGKTGNAATTYEHCHFEVRQYTWTKGLNPANYMGFSNKTGIYGSAMATTKTYKFTASVGDYAKFKTVADELNIKLEELQ